MAFGKRRRTKRYRKTGKRRYGKSRKYGKSKKYGRKSMKRRKQRGLPQRYRAPMDYKLTVSKDPAMERNFKFVNKYANGPNSVGQTVGVAGVIPLWFCANSMDPGATVNLFPASVLTGYNDPHGRVTDMLARFDRYYVVASKVKVRVTITSNTYDVGETVVTITPLTASQALNPAVILPQPLTNSSVFAGPTNITERYHQACSMPRTKIRRVVGTSNSGANYTTISAKCNMNTLTPFPYWMSNSAFWESITHAVDLADRNYYHVALWFLNPTITQTIHVKYEIEQTFWLHAFEPAAASIVLLASRLPSDINPYLKEESKDEMKDDVEELSVKPLAV